MFIMARFTIIPMYRMELEHPVKLMHMQEILLGLISSVLPITLKA
jgi:hypothetical protein